MAALVQPGDAGGFFQDGAPVERLLADEQADLALPHEGGGACARRGIGKEYLHVALAHVAPVDAVDRSRFALDAPRDFDGVIFVVSRARVAFGIVDEESHLGHVARRPSGGTREDHIIHFAAANRGGACFAHHPAQRIEKVGFAATVRADNGGQPRLEIKFGRFNEGFETG